jgi:hypothetical protein
MRDDFRDGPAPGDDRLRLLANAVGYQLVWFSAVIGAGRGLAWPALLAAAMFIAFELRRPGGRSRDLRLIVAAVCCGMVIDGGLAMSGLAVYATPWPSTGAAPAWILAIWAAFAVTLARSLRLLLPRPGLAMALGAVGGPLAYLGAARGWAAVSFDAAPWPALAALALGWAVALPLLCRLARPRAPATRARIASR